MKILQVTNSFKYAWSSGGVARVAYDLSIGLTKRGHKVTVFSTDKGLCNKLDKNRAINVDGIETYYFDNLSNALAKTGIAIPFYAALSIGQRQKDFDIIHIHEPRRVMNILVYRYARKYNIPYVFQAHGALPPSKSFTKRIISWLFDCFFSRQFLRDASSVIALTAVEVEQYRAFGVPEEKINLIGNAINLDEYANLPCKGLFRKKLNIPENQKVVLFLGRINEIKGLDTLIKSFAGVSAEIDNVKLVIVGPDDGYLGQVKELIETFKLKDKVTISGALYGSDKIEAYVDADVFVLPSRYETFPMSLLEAYACSKPVVVSAVGSMSDLVETGVTGILVKPQDVGDLSSAIVTLLKNDCKAKEMGLKGKSFVEENFTIDKIVLKLECLYNNCVVSNDSLPPRRRL
jgi:glycosyltransferase involved in cell wall biosynthesis